MLTLKYISRKELADLDSGSKLRKLLKSVKEDKILIVEGKLSPLEEAELIQMTMELVDRKFRGIEICSVDGIGKNVGISEKVRNYLASLLLGNAGGMSIVGPANLIKEIRKNPDKIELLMNDSRTRSKKKKKKGKI